MTSLRDLLVPKGPIRVIVEVTPCPVEAAQLRRLAELGLDVERVVRDKVVGTIAPEKLSALEADPAVVAVERSVQLKRHS